MPRIRVLHQLNFDQGNDVELLATTKGTRSEAGCLEAEAYRGFENHDQVAIVELWEDDASYTSYWEKQLSAKGQDAPLCSSPEFGAVPASTEFYAQSYFHRPERAWQPIESVPHGKIAWPARDGVRIISQGSGSNLDEWLPWGIANSKETRREPGCSQFDHLRSVEVVEHTLLLELWDPPQAIYDADWQLRLKSNATALGVRRESTERKLGRSGIEFYRYQRFTHLYDRWLPVEVDRWSETVVWPD